MLENNIKKDSVSLAKAIGIILMVLAHTFFSKFGDTFINMFHMSIFFFCAGFCFNEANLVDFKGFAKKRLKGLYFPYIKWSLFFLLLHNVLFRLNIYNSEFGFMGRVSQKYELSDFFMKSIHLVTRMFDHEQLLGGFWFLRCLFIVSFLGYAFIKYSNIKKNYIFVFFALLCGAILASYFDIHVPIVGVGSKELIALLVFLVGYLCKNKKNTLSLRNVPFAIIVALIGSFLWPMSYLSVTWWKIIPWVTSSVLCTMAIIELCQLLDKRKFVFKSILVYIGNNTLSILALHFLCFKIVSLLIICIHNLSIKRLAEFPVIQDYTVKGWWIVYLVIGVIFPISFNMVFHRISRGLNA